MADETGPQDALTGIYAVPGTGALERRKLRATDDGAAHVQSQSIVVLTGGQSAAVSISTTSAQSAAITTPSVVVTPTVDCFFRQGANPTALSDGTDQILLATNSYRLSGIVSGNKLAFITASGTGTVYITPGA
jgi:hypothetical protein